MTMRTMIVLAALGMAAVCSFSCAPTSADPPTPTATPSPTPSVAATPKPDDVAASKTPTSPTVPSSSELAKFIKITDVKVLPFTTANGTQMRRVWVKWQNQSKYPIKSLFARIEPFDAHNHPTEDGIDSYCIYAAMNSSQVVQPMAFGSYSEDEGYVLIHGIGNGDGFSDTRTAKITPVKAEPSDIKIDGEQ